MRQFKERAFLTQTDTTVGFVSQSATQIDTIKQRPPYKHYIIALPTLEALKAHTRVPQRHKNRLRRSRKTSFIMPNTHSYRVVDGSTAHWHLLSRLGWLYTSSANLSGMEYDELFARGVADIIVGSPDDAMRSKPSKIFKINSRAIGRIR